MDELIDKVDTGPSIQLPNLEEIAAADHDAALAALDAEEALLPQASDPGPDFVFVADEAKTQIPKEIPIFFDNNNVQDVYGRSGVIVMQDPVASLKHLLVLRDTSELAVLIPAFDQAAYTVLTKLQRTLAALELPALNEYTLDQFTDWVATRVDSLEIDRSHSRLAEAKRSIIAPEDEDSLEPLHEGE